MQTNRVHQFRKAIEDARAGFESEAAKPFKQVLEDMAAALSAGDIQAWVVASRGGRYTLKLSPLHRPGQVFPMLDVVVGATVEILMDPKQQVTTPDELAEVLGRFITMPAFLESLDEIASMSKEPVEAFLRVSANTISLPDVLLEVSPEQQQCIAEHLDKEIKLQVPISTNPGAGVFEPSADYTVMQSAGYSIELNSKVHQEQDGKLSICGRVARD